MKRLSSLVAASLSAALLAACSGSGIFTSQSAPVNALPSQRQAARNVLASKLGGPTLYVLNSGPIVTVYAHGGAALLRTLVLGKYGPGASMAVDPAGHLYASSSSFLNIYKDRGATIEQTVVQRNAFGLLTLDATGNLFTLCASDRLCEYAAGKEGRLKHIIRKLALRKLGAAAGHVAVDGSGNLAISSGSLVLVFAPRQASPYWKITGICAGAIEFDSSGNLYVANNTACGQTTSVDIYAPVATSPSRSITDGVFNPVALAFDASGNLYVLNFGTRDCSQFPSVTVYAPGGSAPTRTLAKGLLCDDVDALAVDSSGNIYVANGGFGSNGAGNVVVYPPHGSSPIRTITQGIQNPAALAIGP